MLLLFYYAMVFAQPPVVMPGETMSDKIEEALHAISSLEHKQIIVVPHRGLWGIPGVPETSLKAVKACYESHYMFCEIDLVMSKDRELILSHDMQLNRTTDAPPTFSTYGGVHDPGNFFRSLNYRSETKNSVPDINGDIYPTFPALKDLHYKDRFGNTTEEKLNTFQEVLEYCKGKDIILALDVKAVNMTDPAILKEYCEIFKLAILEARQAGMLHQIIFKPGSSGQVLLKDLKAYLTSAGFWEEFSLHTNVILINIIGNAFPLATNKEYLDEWLSLPSLIAIEHIYKNPLDGLLIPLPDLGNLSVIEYTKHKGKKTGIFHPIPTNESGTPVGRGAYLNPKNFGDLNDFRGDMEFLLSVSESNYPGILVSDRPDVESSFLELFGLYSKYTKRDF